MCEWSDVVPSIIAALEQFGNDNRVQIEGLRALVAASDAVEVVETRQIATAAATLKRSMTALVSALTAQ